MPDTLRLLLRAPTPAERKYLEKDTLNLGFRLEPAAWGLGYASELGLELLRHAFDELNLTEMFALVRPANSASIRVLEKIGMHRIGALDDVTGQPQSLLYRASPIDTTWTCA